MKILFVMRHPLYLRNYESTIRQLAEEGHDIVLAFTPLRKHIETTLLDELTAEFASITAEWLPRRTDRWHRLADGARRLRDFLRYLHPRYEQAEKLRTRAASPMPGFIRIPFEIPILGTHVLAKVASTLIAGLEQCFPLDSDAVAFVNRINPDLFLVTPLIDMTYNQQEYLKAARHLGIRSCLLVASWDNLTNKGLIQIKPDRTFVWNEFQKREAMEMHGLLDHEVVVTGAQLFDQWFSAQPATGYEDYCLKVGLQPDVPYFLYVCSSIFIAREEAEFVREWIRAIRSNSDPALAGAGIVIRPHPGNAKQWEEADLSSFDNVAVWPRSGAVPVDDQSKTDYFDSLYHAKAVVGVNTSAFIEAGILGKPVLTIRDPRFAETQDGTLHFHYLVNEGLLETAGDLSEHIAQLERVQTGDQWYVEGNERFLKAFVRPLGLNRAATPGLVSALVEFSKTPVPKPLERWWGASFVLGLLYPLTWIVQPKIKGGGKSKNVPIGIKAKMVRGALRVFVRALDVLGLKNTFRRHVLPQILAASTTDNPDTKLAKAQDVAAEVRQQLRELASSPKTIIIGPWLSEVGFEVLYWIPFLNWAIEEFGFDKQRLVVISRGGTAAWYDGLAEGGYVDVFEFVSPSDFHARTEERWQEAGGQKQLHLSAFDKEMLGKVREKLGLDKGQVEVLHPALMYSLYRPYWRGGISSKLLMKTIAFRHFPRPKKSGILKELPKRYAAVRFYFRPSFPDTPDNRAFVARTLSAVARRIPVVVLNPGFRIDDHEDYDDLDAGRVISIDEFMTPETNLAVQSEVIAGAELFLGTYGGLSYLPPFYNVPSLAFFSNREHFQPTHLTMAHAAYLKLVKVPGGKQEEMLDTRQDARNTASFTVLSVSEARLMVDLLGARNGTELGSASATERDPGYENVATVAVGETASR